MVYGYARVSTLGQARDGNSLEAQESALQQAGADTRLDRIARSLIQTAPLKPKDTTRD